MSSSVSSNMFPESFESTSFPDAFLIGSLSVAVLIETCKSGVTDLSDITPESSVNV